MKRVDRILKRIGRDNIAAHDLHILRVYSALVAVSGGRVIEVFEPTLKYCPLANSLYKNFRRLNTVQENPLLFKEAVREAVEEKISRFGFFTEKRNIFQAGITIPYGASEMLMYALRKGQIEAAVTVCDGAGTVISSCPEIVQGIGARMNGLFFTTPFPAVVGRLERNNCAVVPGGRIDQIQGVKMAIRLGYRNIAVTVNGYRGADLGDIRELEKGHNVSITILVVCTTGTVKKRILEIKKNADLVWSCGSGDIRGMLGREAILQMSVIIPVFVLTPKGIHFSDSYCSGDTAMNTLDAERQYVLSRTPQGREITVGNFKAYLCETKLPVRSKKEPW
jgi:putative methanogenesis marker protein 8